MALVGTGKVSFSAIWIGGVNEATGVEESNGTGVRASQISSRAVGIDNVCSSAVSEYDFTRIGS